LDRSSELEKEKVEKILRLPIVHSLFQNFEHQHVGAPDNTLRLKKIYAEDNSEEIEGLPRS